MYLIVDYVMGTSSDGIVGYNFWWALGYNSSENGIWWLYRAN